MTGRDQGRPSPQMGNETSFWLRRASLTTVVFQNTALALCMRYSRLPKPQGEARELYLVTTAVFAGEALKLLVSIVLASWHYSVRELIVMFFSTESFRMLVPAVLYSLQNSLQYVAASNLDISVCQVLYQMKLVTTALFSVAMLNRQLTPPQWWGIFLCALGVAAVQLSTAENSQQKAGQQAWVGFLAVSVACITSGLAAVYTEKVFKSGNSSLWVRNMHLAGWSLVAISWGLVANDGSKIREKGFFLGWNFLVCVVVALQALGGMAVAVVAKYADNISKGFATAISIILTCVASVYLFDLHPSATFTAGTSLVLLSLYLYTRPVKNGQTIKYMEISQKDLEDHHDLPDKVQQSAFRIGKPDSR